MKSPGLKLIILYKTVMGFFELTLSVYLFNIYRQSGDVFGELASRLDLNLNGAFMSFAMDKLGMLTDSTVLFIIMVIFLFGVFNYIEAYGLHMRRRWAEWLTVVATAILIPFELYDLVRAFSYSTLVVMVINSAIVYYLARHKELFKSSKAGQSVRT